MACVRAGDGGGSGLACTVAGWAGFGMAEMVAATVGGDGGGLRASGEMVRSGRLKAIPKSILNVKKLSKDAKYLGNPLFYGKNKLKDFEEVRKKVELRLKNWKANLLSQAGRLVLVKSVVSSIPIYAMSASKLPLTWCRNIDKMTSKFLWRGEDLHRVKFIPTAWSKVCRPKAQGDLGMRKFEEVKVAMLCRLGWALETNVDSPWIKALKAKYFPSTPFMRCSRKKSSFWQWKDSVSNISRIFWADPLLDDKLIWIGSSSGNFTVRFVYRLIHTAGSEKSKWWNFLWSSELHDRLKFFM
nr:uncharacterized protein LOC125423184 [Ziziphus jujuba var. spinosa]